PRELPRGSGPAFAEAERRLRPDGSALSLPFSLDLALSFWVRKPALRFFPLLNESSRRSGLRQLSRELTARALAAHARSRRALFERKKGSFRELPRGSGPAFAEAERRLRP
ncbi:hypothetical protein M9458_046077, partial [Cirrhinus mrigala]